MWIELGRAPASTPFYVQLVSPERSTRTLSSRSKTSIFRRGKQTECIGFPLVSLMLCPSTTTRHDAEDPIYRSSQ